MKRATPKSPFAPDIHHWQTTARIPVLAFLLVFGVLLWDEWRQGAAHFYTRLIIFGVFAFFLFFLVQRSLKQQQEILRSSARFEAVVNHSSDMVVIVGRDGCMRYISPVVTKITGLPADSAIGKHYRDLSHRDDYTKLDASWQHLLSHPDATDLVRYRSRHLTKGWITVEASAAAHFDTPGIEGVLLLLRDVSQQIEAEQRLQRSETSLRKAQAVARIGSWYLDISTNSLTWSEETYRIFGIAIGTPMTMELFMSCIHPEDRDMVKAEWQAALTGEPYDIGHRIIVDGEVLWVQEKADLSFDANGELTGGIGTVQDVTAQHEAAVQLTELLEFNEKIIAESPVGIAVFRADGPCILSNEALGHIIGGAPDEAHTQNFRRIPAWRTLGLLDAAMEALHSGKPTRCVAKGESSFGKSIAIDCEFACINRHGERHLLVLAHDISEFHAAEEALKEAMMFAEEGNRAKSEFLANMSHEIRTPMNAVMGLAQLAISEANDPRLIEHLKQIYRSANMLLSIINDILDYSKIEAGGVHLEQLDFNTHDLAATIAGMFRVPIQEKAVALNIHIADDVPPGLVGDALRINQVLINLVGNSVKFTESGEITVAIERVTTPAMAATSNTVRLRFSVTDTGIGMDDMALSRLFQPFVQADGSITRRYGGTGLGLSISRRLVQMMGSDIEVDSAPGRGSRFHFELDLAVSANKHPDGTQTPYTLISPTPSAISPAPTLTEQDALALKIQLAALIARVSDNDFIAVTELAELHAAFAPLVTQSGDRLIRLDAAISRYEYTTAKQLLSELLAIIDAPSTAPGRLEI